MYRRLNQLTRAGYLNRRRMLWSGEYFYYLGRKGVELLEAAGDSVPHRAKNPVKETLQRHEFEVARFWIKFMADCRTEKAVIEAFWRDGELSMDSGKDRWRIIPDGAAALVHGSSCRLILLELDRSTEVADGHLRSLKSVRAKFERYLHGRRAILNHPEIKPLAPNSLRVLVICISEERLNNLLAIADSLGIRNMIAFTCLPRFIDLIDNTATGWKYHSHSLLTSKVFSFPNRSPPESLF